MNQVTATLIGAIADIVAVILSLTAIIVALRTEARAGKRFQSDLQTTQEIAAANLKPVIAVFVSEYIHLKSMRLGNYGAGTAIITSTSISKDGKAVDNVALLFNLPRVLWDTFWTFSQSRLYLRPGQEITLVKLSAENLISQGYSEEEALRILETWQQQLDGIRFHIQYEDLLGNKQEDYERVLEP